MAGTGGGDSDEGAFTAAEGAAAVGVMIVLSASVEAGLVALVVPVRDAAKPIAPPIAITPSAMNGRSLREAGGFTGLMPVTTDDDVMAVSGALRSLSTAGPDGAVWARTSFSRIASGEDSEVASSIRRDDFGASVVASLTSRSGSSSTSTGGATAACFTVSMRWVVPSARYGRRASTSSTTDANRLSRSRSIHFVITASKPSGRSLRCTLGGSGST